MNVEIDFEKLKQTILLAAQKQGLSEEYVIKNWHINYKINQNEEFIGILSNFQKEIKLLNQAITNNDLLTSIRAIVRAKVYSQLMLDFFDKIDDDIFQLGWRDELKGKWPKIPEDYQVPAHYDYEETYKPHSQQIAEMSSS
jgi:hypothetical protein